MPLWNVCNSMRVEKFIQFNPKIQLKKGTKAKKVDMDKLVPFTRKITGYIEADFTGGSKFINGDTLLARITPCLENGKTAYVNVLEDKEVGFGSTEFIVLRAIEGISIPLFIYYLAVSPDFREIAIASMSGTSGRQRVDVKALEQLEINLPPLEEQKRIAEVLGAFDDKIELLQKQNKTLEDMAKALFKSWFVDFDVVRAKQKGLPKADIMREYHLTEELYDLFPSSFADSSLGPIPTGWEVKPLGAICQLALGGTPSRTNLKYWEKGSIPWINSGKVNDFRIITPSEYITEAGYNSSATKLLPIHTTVVAITGATLGQVSFTEIECCANQSVVGVLENEKLASEYIYLFILFNLDKLLAKQTGGAQQHINKNDIASLICLVPSEKILEQYKQKQKPLFDKIHNNMVQIELLTEIRNNLLPRLISGKIRV